MKTLGIDYGRRKVGLAMAEFSLATPISVVRFESEGELMDTLRQLITKEHIERLVVGVSEGEMAQEAREFGQVLQSNFDLPLYYQDETLTSHDAQVLSRETGKGAKKRREMEDAYAAALILQSFLDDN